MNHGQINARHAVKNVVKRKIEVGLQRLELATQQKSVLKGAGIIPTDDGAKATAKRGGIIGFDPM